MEKRLTVKTKNSRPSDEFRIPGLHTTALNLKFPKLINHTSIFKNPKPQTPKPKSQIFPPSLHFPIAALIRSQRKLSLVS
ncbi:hypothetical protein Csa_005133 [Cucumis sativus]|uniref:Uncharacterized protein n=1 Tax=Cucumis sativus TaxID=3659 RepID=A0A0A0K9U7_CUCSA|nr:hypothetical protein Csa_005133 [Cucumis sativus]